MASALRTLSQKSRDKHRISVLTYQGVRVKNLEAILNEKL